MTEGWEERREGEGRGENGEFKVSHRGHRGTEFFRTQRRAGARREDTETGEGNEQFAMRNEE